MSPTTGALAWLVPMAATRSRERFTACANETARDVMREQPV